MTTSLEGSVHAPARTPPLWVFFVLAYALTWMCWIPRALASRGYIELPFDPLVLHIAGAFGPCLAAVGVALVFGGKNALGALLLPYTRWRVNWKWFAFVLLARPLLWLAALFGHIVFEKQAFTWPPVDWAFESLYLVSQLLVVGVGEELGWSGFAIPRMQRRFGLGWASLIVGVLWGLWHLPFFFTVGDSQYGSSLLLFIVKLTAFRFLFSWTLLRTGSLLMPGLFHVSFNTLTELVPLSPNDPLAILLSVCAALGVWVVSRRDRSVGVDN